VIDDDAFDAGLDGRLHVGSLPARVGLCVVDLNLESGRVGLLPDADGPLLEVVTGAAVLDESDLHRACVEGGGFGIRNGACGGASHARPVAVVVLGAGEQAEQRAHPQNSG
jgi:hypothetical protein